MPERRRARSAALVGTVAVSLLASAFAVPAAAGSPVAEGVDASVAGTVDGLPAAVDWRESHAVTEAKNKGQCAEIAGKAYATAAALEGAWVVQDQNPLTRFTPLITDADGQDVYPSVCGEPRPAGESLPTGAFKEWAPVTSGDEEALKAAVARGPVRTKIDSSHVSFTLYSEGVYDEPLCSSSNTDHYVTVVGYGTDPAGQDYWIVKNDYGVDWGDAGFALMSRNNSNQCGIATEAEEPVLNPAPYDLPSRNPWPTFP
ncbi:C1 family peptidase (plasmid) [Streptomyces sp. NBC_01471]|uniref:C1 family peptidase n=1 Tax=Streptomyces sp. NBC_01471 TaxID=2903879 RepID=UPI002F91679A